MPELPEVETIRAGIADYIVGRKVVDLVVRNSQLRVPISDELRTEFPGQILNAVDRRAKYLLFRTNTGTMLLHLGMSGSLRLLREIVPPGIHDHLDINFDGEITIRFNDPRRFGKILWITGDPLQQLPLCNLGPEPLDSEFTGNYLYQRSRGRRIAIKSLIMDQRIVSGIGNIYATEALFRAGIHPIRAVGSIDEGRYQQLIIAIRQVLTEAIAKGGTTLRDFHHADGQAGYFQFALQIYGRAGKDCPNCGHLIKEERHGQRNSFYCTHCQT